MKDKAERFNEGKPQLSYILEADYAIEGLTRVLEFGAAKYARSNYQASKMPAREIIDSLLRHITKYLAGEELDDESGLPHADHVLANALFFAYHHNGLRDMARKDVLTEVPLEEFLGTLEKHPDHPPKMRVEGQDTEGRVDGQLCEGYSKGEPIKLERGKTSEHVPVSPKMHRDTSFLAMGGDFQSTPPSRYVFK